MESGGMEKYLWFLESMEGCLGVGNCCRICGIKPESAAELVNGFDFSFYNQTEFMLEKWGFLISSMKLNGCFISSWSLCDSRLIWFISKTSPKESERGW